MMLTLEALTPGGAAYAIGIAALLGACMGSFINCLAWRVVAGESVLHGRSHCPECNHDLGLLDLIPVFSWVFLRGKCRYCKTKISARYVGVEVVMSLIFVALVLCFGIGIQALAYAALACILCGITLVDYDTRTIPNGFIVAGVVVWLVTVWFMYVPVGRFAQGTLFVETFGYGFLAVLVDGLLAAFAIGGGMLALSVLFDKLTGKRSLGGGDVKLFFMVSLFLGVAMGLFNLLLACVFGLLFIFVGNALFGSSKPESDALTQKESLKTKHFPFGPAIAAATMVSLLVGSDALTWYIGLLL